MEIQGSGPLDAWLKLTEVVRTEKRITPASLVFPVPDEPWRDFNNAECLCRRLESKKPRYILGQPVSMFRWSFEVVWPQILYEQNDCSLAKLMKDARFGYKGFHRKDTCHSQVGQIANEPNWLAYAIHRWSDPELRLRPHFYFPIMDLKWVFEELLTRPYQVKSGRTYISCMTNLTLRWDSKNKQAWVMAIYKHCDWSHSVGDVFGLTYFIKAFLKEVNLAVPANVAIFFCSVVADKPRVMREILEEAQTIPLKEGAIL